MDCKETLKLISIYIDEELDEDARWELELHVDRCQRCQRELESLRRTIELTRSLEEVSPPANLASRIQKRVKNIRPVKNTGSILLRGWPLPLSSFCSSMSTNPFPHAL